jgi:iron complex outermembrane receptor protein
MLTVGAEYRNQSFRSSIGPADLVQAPETDRDRTVSALYALTAVPILAPSRNAWHVKLDLSASFRYEHYSDVGQAASPQFGFAFEPVRSVSLTGAWTRLFHAPNLPDLNEGANISQLVPLPDPKSPTGFSTALLWAGNNASLRPEIAHSWNLAIAFKPVSYPNFSASLSYFNITSTDRVLQTQVMPMDVLSNPQDSWLVTRGATAADRAQVCSRSQFYGLPEDCLNAPIAALVDIRLHNVETLRTDGLDFASRYALGTGMGEFTADLDGTYVLRYRQSETPSGQLDELRGTPHNPPGLRVRSSLGWARRGFSVRPTVNFQSAYHDPFSNPELPVSAWTTWDLVLQYAVPSFVSGLDNDVLVTLAGQNVFNSQPPFVNNRVAGIGYDPENGNLLGRRVSIALEYHW